ncbi:hypothetical protein P154DRAFT_159755 [Amniculicola lignicola CBS 123094]|uniref:Uncharacterized protein n=1 Tax=Amniculicola lignicola CBS 123094 TaxID=1392246 RepID=A0A6A5WL91_9PLEO|nr:hypothetical protein P154DRAFT_159755 [Amniculicola lignicola CBS 123094]
MCPLLQHMTVGSAEKSEESGVGTPAPDGAMRSDQASRKGGIRRRGHCLFRPRRCWGASQVNVFQMQTTPAPCASQTEACSHWRREDLDPAPGGGSCWPCISTLLRLPASLRVEYLLLTARCRPRAARGDQRLPHPVFVACPPAAFVDQLAQRLPPRHPPSTLHAVTASRITITLTVPGCRRRSIHAQLARPTPPQPFEFTPPAPSRAVSKLLGLRP